VNFNFTVDVEGTAVGKVAAPGGKLIELSGVIHPEGGASFAASDFGDTNYFLGMAGVFKSNTDDSVTGSGEVADSTGEMRSWTARRTTAGTILRVVSGRVVNSQGVGVSGVTIKRSGTGTIQTITDLSGNYQFRDVAAGTYTITPSRLDLTFSPTVRSVTVTNANVVVPTFTTLFRVQGQVLTPNGYGIPNVRITRNGSTAAVLTNSQGVFNLTGVPSGSVTVSASRAGFVMTPASRTLNITTNSISNVRFASAYTISGRVVNSAGVGIAGVTMKSVSSSQTLTATTSATGNFVFNNIGFGTYNVTATRLGLTFTPSTQRAVTTLGNNVVLPNFRAGFNLTGRVTTSAGVGISGVRVTRSGSTEALFTNTSGHYTFLNVPAGNWVVTPTLAGTTFAPATRSVAVTVAPVTVATFIGTKTAPLTNSLSRSVVTSDSIVLSFASGLDADSATDASRYSVTVNGQSIEVESVSFNRASGTVTLGLPESTLRSGDNVHIAWNNVGSTAGSTEIVVR
jgi:hypothetical protein